MEKSQLPMQAYPATGPVISDDVRRQMIATAAYLRAERRGFRDGDPLADWLQAEEEINRMLERSLRSQRMASAKAKQGFVSRLEGELRELDDCLARAARKIRGSPQGIVDKYADLYDLYSENRAAAVLRLKTLQDLPGSAWESLRVDTETLWHELDHTADEIAAFAALSCCNKKAG